MPPGTKGEGRLQTYVALLRGINLGARNKVAMEELRTLFDTLGAEDVRTYVQSGNVVFKSSVRSPADLSRAIERRLTRDVGVTATVLLRTKAQLGKVASGNPFAKDGRELARLHVTFLADAPGRARVRDLDARRGEPDEFHVVGTEIYLHCPNGYGRTKLTNAYFEKHLRTTATTRNWKTVTKLFELSSA